MTNEQEQQARAWLAVWDALKAYNPDFAAQGYENGQESALAEIKRLQHVATERNQLQAHLDRVLLRESTLSETHRELANAHRELATAHGELQGTIARLTTPAVPVGPVTLAAAGEFTPHEGDGGIDFDGVSTCSRMDCSITIPHRHLSHAEAAAQLSSQKARQQIMADHIADRLSGKTNTVEFARALAEAADDAPSDMTGRPHTQAVDGDLVGTNSPMEDSACSDETSNNPGKPEQER